MWTYVRDLGSRQVCKCTSASRCPYLKVPIFWSLTTITRPSLALLFALVTIAPSLSVRVACFRLLHHQHRQGKALRSPHLDARVMSRCIAYLSRKLLCSTVSCCCCDSYYSSNALIAYIIAKATAYTPAPCCLVGCSVLVARYIAKRKRLHFHA